MHHLLVQWLLEPIDNILKISVILLLHIVHISWEFAVTSDKHIHIWHKPYPFESYSCLALTCPCTCNMLAVNYESSVLSRNLEVLVMRTSKKGVWFCFVSHFWDCLSPGSLGKDVPDAFWLRRKCCCQFGINFHDIKFGSYSYMVDMAPERIVKNLPPSRDHSWTIPY